MIRFESRTVSSVYREVVQIEMGYRGLDCSVSDVLLDTMRCIFQWEEDELKQ